MKTINEVYEDSIDRISKVDLLNEVSSKIFEITNALYKKELGKWSGDELSRAVLSLAVLRVRLGETMVNAVAYYDISYMHRKMRYANEWQPTKSHLNNVLNKATVQDVDNAIIKKLEDNLEEEVKYKHYAEQLRTLYDSTETLITALQTRLGVLKQERAESQYQK